MDLHFDLSLAEGYTSNSQIARRLTEGWVTQNMYCPRCGNSHIQHYENNRPVADFFCPACNSEYELKSKSGNLSDTVSDGAYHTMIERITGNDNPDFFFMGYNRTQKAVTDLIMVPKYFFVPDIIVKRKPLAATAHRAGWTGCNIVLSNIPIQGRVYIIHNSQQIPKEQVIEKLRRSQMLKTKEISARSWLMDILHCVNAIPDTVFTLDQIYTFESILQNKHPGNHNIRPKIRQQLQLLREKGFLEFLGSGRYRKLMRCI